MATLSYTTSGDMIMDRSRSAQFPDVGLHDHLEITHGSGNTVLRSHSWRHSEDLMASVPGIGTAISRTVLAELPELDKLDRRQVAALADRAPFTPRSPCGLLHGVSTRQSGRWRGKAFIAAGRATVRSPLFVGPWSPEAQPDPQGLL